MSIEVVCIIGAGGHARVVADAILSVGPTNLNIFDSDPERCPSPFLGQYDVALFVPENMAGKNCHVAVGSNEAREKLSLELSSMGADLVVVEHRDSSVSRFAKIGAGCFVAAQALIGPGAKVGAGTIVNHAAIVDHDCAIGIYSHLAPGSVLGGGVAIGERCLIGAGTIILPGISIGDDVIIGAGSVVTKNVPSNSKWAGIPAKAMETLRNG